MNEGASLVEAHAKQAKVVCFAAGGKVAALTVLQQLSGSPNAVDRPDAVEAGLLKWVGEMLQCPDVVSLHLGWHMYSRCKPRMHELRVDNIAESGFCDDDADEYQLGDDSTSSVPATGAVDSCKLLLVCCWSASKLAGRRGDAATAVDVASTLRLSNAAVFGIEWQVLNMLEFDVMRGFPAFLQGLGLCLRRQRLAAVSE
jgi:hypothetical protein